MNPVGLDKQITIDTSNHSPEEHVDRLVNVSAVVSHHPSVVCYPGVQGLASKAKTILGQNLMKCVY